MNYLKKLQDITDGKINVLEEIDSDTSVLGDIDFTINNLYHITPSFAKTHMVREIISGSYHRELDILSLISMTFNFDDPTYPYGGYHIIYSNDLDFYEDIKFATTDKAKIIKIYNDLILLG